AGTRELSGRDQAIDATPDDNGIDVVRHLVESPSGESRRDIRSRLWCAGHGDWGSVQDSVATAIFIRPSHSRPDHAAVFKMILPVDARVSSLRWASTASDNGNTLSMCSLSQPSRIPFSTSPARRSNSSRGRV